MKLFVEVGQPIAASAPSVPGPLLVAIGAAALIGLVGIVGFRRDVRSG